MKQRECEAKAQHHRKETKKKNERDEGNAMLCPSCAKWSLFFCQERTKGEAVKEVREDKEEKEATLLETLCLPEAPSTRSPD